MTTPGGEIEGETAEGPVAARPDLAATSPSPTWVAFVAWAVALTVIVALSGLAAATFRSTGAAVQDAADRLENATAELRPPPEITPLPGLPPARPETAHEASGDETASDAVVTEAAWLRRPVGDFPEKAQRLGVEYGEVQLECPVDAEGRIASCWILSETPTGAGFGQAALEGAVQARLSPRTVNGLARSGTVRFTTRFALE